MALEEKSVVDKIEVLLNGSIQVRRRDQILKDNNEGTKWTEVAATYHRHVVNPGDDVSNEDPRVAAIAAATWTEEVVAEYEAAQASAE